LAGQSYPMSDADQEIQAAARTLADELLPHEVTVELAGGELPDGLLAAQRRRVAELGFEAINMPRELGGGGFSAFQQVLVQEQIGRVTNALGWVVHTPAYSHTYPYHHPVVAFEGVRVPAGQLIGAEGDGMRFAYEWFRYERLMIAARALGAAERLIEEATAFARERRAYGRPIFDYQAVQFMLADSLTELWAARLMTYQTAHGLDADSTSRSSTPSARWPSCTPRRWPAGSPTGPCRSSAAAATCARTWPSASTGSCGSTGSGRAPRRSSGPSSPTSWPSGASPG
jgi:alkylation response protein AidB-like acyl-CoA dehydrogenase